VRLYKLMIKNMFWPIGLIPVLELLLKQFILTLKSIFRSSLSETFLGKMKEGEPEWGGGDTNRDSLEFEKTSEVISSLGSLILKVQKQYFGLF